MASSGGAVNASSNPQNWGFMPGGNTQQAALAASTLTITLASSLSVGRPPPQAAFWNVGTALAFVAFGGTSTITVGVATAGMPIAGTALMGGGLNDVQILSTNHQGYLVIGSAGTGTVWITPGQGSR